LSNICCIAGSSDFIISVLEISISSLLGFSNFDSSFLISNIIGSNFLFVLADNFSATARFISATVESGLFFLTSKTVSL